MFKVQVLSKHRLPAERVRWDTHRRQKMHIMYQQMTSSTNVVLYDGNHFISDRKRFYKSLNIMKFKKLFSSVNSRILVFTKFQAELNP